MVIVLLSLLLGVATYAALVHLLAGLRREEPRLNLSLAVVAAWVATYAALSVALRLQTEPDAAARLLQWQGAVAFLLMLSLYAFLAVYAGVRSRWILSVLTVLLVAGAAWSLFDPAGPFFGSVDALASRHAWWERGDVRLPVGAPQPYVWVVAAVYYGPLLYMGHALLKQYRRGQQGRAVLATLGLLVPVVAGAVDLVLLERSTFPLPWLEIGYLLLLLLISLGLADEVHRRARLEREMAQRERFYRSVMEAAPYGVAILDPGEDRVLAVNARARELLALDGVPLPAQLSHVMPAIGDDSEVAKTALARALRGERPVVERRREEDDDDQPRYLEVRLAPVEGATERTLVRASVIDVSDRKDAEARERALQAELNHAQRLETIGTLAGGIAHEFNNLLTPILGLADAALTQPDPARVERDLGLIRDAAQRARDLVRRILAFGRSAPVSDEVVVLQDAVVQAERLVAAALPARVRLTKRLDAPAARVRLDAGRIQQVVMNLCVNASQAMPEGGDLFLSLEEKVPAYAEAPGVVELVVRDTGVGIPQEALPRIFDPFFTTKQRGKGTGLGLSVVHGIVKAAGGTLEVESEVGRGTCVTVQLPTTVEPAGVERPRPRPPAPHAGVLLIDDDPLILQSLVRMAEAAGYRATGYTSAAEGLAAIEAGADPQAVLVDFDMPEANGARVAGDIRRHRPDVRIVCLTGTVLDREAAEAFDGVLLKPPSLDDLRTVLGSAEDPDEVSGAGRSG